MKKSNASVDTNLFPNSLMSKIRKEFSYIDTDAYTGKKRIFFDNAGGSLKLTKANSKFSEIDMIPDHPLRNHSAASYLSEIKDKGVKDIKEVIFNAQSGSIVPFLTASKAIFDVTGIIAEYVKGSNMVTTKLEHPSAYDAVKYYSKKLNKEMRIAPTNPITGGVDVEDIVSLIDDNTNLLSVIYASNISGAIIDVETIVKKAREKKPDIFIIIDAVQHVPHGIIDVQKLPVDLITFAPYKFFGVRGLGIAYISERASSLPHHKLYNNDSLELGSPIPAHYASISKIVDYVCWIGSYFLDNKYNKRTLFVEGMNRIKSHEQELLNHLLNGSKEEVGLRNIPNVNIHLDYHDLSTRDLIIAMSIKNIDNKTLVNLYEQKSIIVYDRVSSNVYSKRMLESFNIEGVVRVSPIHCHDINDINYFLKVTNEIASNNF